MKPVLVLLAVLLTLGSPATVIAQEPSAARMSAAYALLEVMDMERTLEKTTDALILQQKQQQPKMAQFEDIMRDFMKKALNWSELQGDYARMYAEIYTEQELRELTALYRTPLGQRLLETLPEVATRSSEISNRRLEKHLPEMQKRIMERMMKNDDR